MIQKKKGLSEQITLSKGQQEPVPADPADLRDLSLLTLLLTCRTDYQNLLPMTIGGIALWRSPKWCVRLNWTITSILV